MTKSAGRKPKKTAATKRPKTTRQLAIVAARLADQNRGEAIEILDLRRLSSVTDFFVLASGGSRRQVQAMSRRLLAFFREEHRQILGVEGIEDGHWVLIDCADVIVHLFQPETREYYGLDLLWGDAPKIRWKLARRSASS